MSSSGDYQLAAAAAGFSLGFGYLTCVRAVHQTRRNRNPWRSAYVYMIWGEIVANLCLGILAWLYLKDVVSTTPILLFFILFFYVFEVQLLMQIIINRIAVISERKSTATRLKIATAVIISCINIAVFCIFIPSHLSPPPSIVFVHINKYWDRCSKILIMLVDAVLNAYFIHVVRARLVKQHGLQKYKPLIGYYIRLGVISVCMDLMLIGLMSLPNAIVFVQFHPVAYMVKLNIEMSMADMIVKLARGHEQDAIVPDSSNRKGYGEPTQRSYHQHTYNGGDDTNIGAKNTAIIGHNEVDDDVREDIHGIARQTEVQVYVGDSDSDLSKRDSTDGRRRDRDRNSYESQIPLKELATPVGLTHSQ